MDAKQTLDRSAVFLQKEFRACRWWRCFRGPGWVVGNTGTGWGTRCRTWRADGTVFLGRRRERCRGRRLPCRRASPRWNDPLSAPDQSEDLENPAAEKMPVAEKCTNTLGYGLTYVTGSHCVECRSLGKVFNTPEVARVYIGSFWDSPLHFDMNRRLFELEEQDLFKDIQSLPRNAALRKLNDLIKRARLAKVSRSRPSERSLRCLQGWFGFLQVDWALWRSFALFPRSFGRAEGQLVFLKVGWSFWRSFWHLARSTAVGYHWTVFALMSFSQCHE